MPHQEPFLVQSAMPSGCLALIVLLPLFAAIGVVRGDTGVISVGPIRLPRTIGSYQAVEAINDDIKRPGLGYTINYASYDSKASVFIYSDGMAIVPEDINTLIFRSHFVKICDVIMTLDPSARSLSTTRKIKIGGKYAWHRVYGYVDKGREVISHVYLGSMRGKYLKIRITDFTNRRCLHIQDDKCHMDFLRTVFEALSEH